MFGYVKELGCEHAAVLRLAWLEIRVKNMEVFKKPSYYRSVNIRARAKPLDSIFPRPTNLDETHEGHSFINESFRGPYSNGLLLPTPVVSGFELLGGKNKKTKKTKKIRGRQEVRNEAWN